MVIINCINEYKIKAGIAPRVYYNWNYPVFSALCGILKIHGIDPEYKYYVVFLEYPLNIWKFSLNNLFLYHFSRNCLTEKPQRNYPGSPYISSIIYGVFKSIK